MRGYLPLFLTRAEQQSQNYLHTLLSNLCQLCRRESGLSPLERLSFFFTYKTRARRVFSLLRNPIHFILRCTLLRPSSIRTQFVVNLLLLLMTPACTTAALRHPRIAHADGDAGVSDHHHSVS